MIVLLDNNQISMHICVDASGQPSAYAPAATYTANCKLIATPFVTPTTATKILFTPGQSIGLTAGATYWIILFGNTNSVQTDVISSSPKSTAANGATLVGEAQTTNDGASWTVASTANLAWEIMATCPTCTTPVSASIVNLNDKAETFASELK